MNLQETKKHFKSLKNSLSKLAGYSLDYGSTPISQIAEMTFIGFEGSKKDKEKLIKYLERITNYEWRKF